MPVKDWQFWVVTAVCLFGLWMVFRVFLPSRRSRRKGKRVQLTIESSKRGDARTPKTGS